MRGSVSDHVVAFWITVVRRAREFGRAVLVGFTLDSLYERYIIRYVLRNSLVGIGPFFSPQVRPPLPAACSLLHSLAGEPLPAPPLNPASAMQVFPHLQVLQDRFKEIRDEIVQVQVGGPFLVRRRVQGRGGEGLSSQARQWRSAHMRTRSAYLARVQPHTPSVNRMEP